MVSNNIIYQKILKVENQSNLPTPNPSGTTAANPPMMTEGSDSVDVDRMMWFSLW